jgi:hypothetical protein
LQVLVRFFMAMSGSAGAIYQGADAAADGTGETGCAADVYFGHAVFEVSHHGRSDARCESDCAKLPAGGERLKPDWTFRWLLDPAQISPGTAMPSGLVPQEGDRWV